MSKFFFIRSLLAFSLFMSFMGVQLKADTVSLKVQCHYGHYLCDNSFSDNVATVNENTTEIILPKITLDYSNTSNPYAFVVTAFYQHLFDQYNNTQSNLTLDQSSLGNLLNCEVTPEGFFLLTPVQKGEATLVFRGNCTVKHSSELIPDYMNGGGFDEETVEKTVTVQIPVSVE